MIPKDAAIVAYDILHGADPGQLALAVSDHLRNGWQPLGTPRHYFDPRRSLWFYQTIVKYDILPTSRN